MFPPPPSAAIWNGLCAEHKEFNMEDEILTTQDAPVQDEAQSVEVVDVQFRPGQKIYFFDPAGNHYQTGDH